MASTCIGPPRPAKFSVRSRYLLNVGDLPNSGTRKWICQDVKQAVFLLYPVLVLKFRILFSVWADSLMKRQSKDSEKQTRHFSDWFPFPVHSKLCSHMLPGEHSSLPRSIHSSLPLLSTRYCISSCYTCSGMDYKLPHAAPWFPCVQESLHLGSSPDSATSWLCGFGRWQPFWNSVPSFVRWGQFCYLPHKTVKVT